MEVGSLSKAYFLKKRIDETVLRWTKKWGEILRIEVRDLISILTGKEPKHAKGLSLEEWASLFGIKFHETAGLDIIYDGEQRRREMYEYPIQHIKGFNFLGHVKVWDTEVFKKAAVVEKVKLSKPYHVDEFMFVKANTSREIKIPITGPYTLADWSYDEYYFKRYGWINDPLKKRKMAKMDLVMDLAKEVIRPNIEELVNRGARRIQIDEPAATTKPDELDIFVEAFNQAVKGIETKITFHICYSDYSKLFPYIFDLKADEFSLACSTYDSWELGVTESKRTGFQILKLFKEYGEKRRVAPGVIDVHTDDVESSELVRDRLLYAAKVLGDPSMVIACNDCGLRTRSWEVAYEKEKNLVKGAELARKELS